MNAQTVLILVVEDEPLIQLILTATLEDAGFAVSMASAGTQAIEKLQADGDTFRAVLTDVDLGDGVQVGTLLAMPAASTKGSLSST